MIKYVHVKHQFDVPLMQQEVQMLKEEYWKTHYNTKHYEGSWKSLPLRSINGSIENCISIQSSSLQKNMSYQDTALLHHCPYLQSVISFFECEKMSIRLMNLDAGAVIKEHTDHELSLEEGEARFHIPIITNTKVDFFLDDERIVMKEGECWYLNLSLKHKVNNFGATNRIHLVLDCKVNSWITELLNADFNQKIEMPEKQQEMNYDRLDKIKIIRQLRLLGTAVAIEMADRLESGNN
jgi:hypothetical protein